MTDTKPGLFSAADVERARQVICREWDDIFPFELTRLALNAGLSPQARRVLEAAVKLNARIAEGGHFGRTQEARDELTMSALDYARSLTEGTETNGDQ